MIIGELLIAITMFFSAQGVTFHGKARCISNLHSCSIQDKAPLEGYERRYLECLKDNKWTR